MQDETIKATITINGTTHQITVSKKMAEQIRRYQKLIKEKKGTNNPTPR